jgi:uridine kinase
VAQGNATDIINVSEALQEKKIAHIAEDIFNRKGVRMVLLAGPSSSGKTTTCKRLSIQLMTCGLHPVQISLDDYFVDRTKTPRDDKGDYDYESLYALNIPLLNRHLQQLFNGEEITLPHYNFHTGTSEMEGGKRLVLRENDILVVEGIHALNPELTAQIPEEKKYRVYASALTTILLDNHNYIPTTDCCAASYATINTVDARPRTPYTAGHRCGLARTNGYSPTRKLPTLCSTPQCSSNSQ